MSELRKWNWDKALMQPTQQTEPIATITQVKRKPLETVWVVNAPVCVQIGQSRARKLVENYEATLEGGTVDHQRLLGFKAWPRYRGRLTHLRRQLAC